MGKRCIFAKFKNRKEQTLYRNHIQKDFYEKIYYVSPIDKP